MAVTSLVLDRLVALERSKHNLFDETSKPEPNSPMRENDHIFLSSEPMFTMFISSESSHRDMSISESI